MAWFGRRALGEHLSFPGALDPRPILSASTNATRWVDSLLRSSVTNSPPPGSFPACPPVRNTDAQRRPNVFLSSQSRCHQQSKQLPLRFSPCPKGPTGVLVSVMLHHSTPHGRSHDGGTDASAERRRELGVPPWARHSSVLREEEAPCNRISVVRHDPHAPRPAPGDRDRPQSVFPARLAPKKKRSCARV